MTNPEGTIVELLALLQPTEGSGMSKLTDEQRRAYIAALLQERAGYAQYGREDRVAEVDAELEKVGHRAKAPAARAEKMTPPKRTET